MVYLWLKGVHVAAVLIFVGGLFAQSLGIAAQARGGAETLRIIARWDRLVTVPAMLMVWLSGTLVAATGAWFSSHWLWTKLIFVVALTGLHGIQSGRLRRLWPGERQGPAARPPRVPAAVALAVAIIAVLAVAKPF
ncbi:hypothetical protein E5A73_11310 [Sphingomonas gei]|uniref:Protoporphyrinogen IX oxidase n=1 Tax=Sphingomonas gei TaxID=1395960 RepID=A0A4S1XAS7_9SPHN|nr:CopD family protein [Sphingomonas gei]TGX53424.1 hypothetical protein E5A73_11310 [Sphingomonas gei]